MLYIDTSRLFSGKAYGLESHIDKLIELLNNHKENLILLSNDILEEEVYRKIKSVNLPPTKLDNCFNDIQIEDVRKILEKNKRIYLEKIDKLLQLAKKIDLKMSNNEIIDGVKRQYDKEPPWKKNEGNKPGKPNEWKDFFVQKSLINYINLDEYKPIILTGDGDFGGMPKAFEIQKQPLKDFLVYIKNQYLEPIPDFKSYLVSKIYSDIENDIVDAIHGYYKNHKEVYCYIEPAIEDTYINDIKILDFTNINKIKILVKANMSYYGYDIWDIPELDQVGVECYMTCSFAGSYNNESFVRGKIDSNTIELIETKDDEIIFNEYKEVPF